MMDDPGHPTPTALERATFGGGCFWCTEAVFERVDGVVSVLSGYAGGTVENPTYEAVCSQATGHAEAVQVAFDPARVSYEDLLWIFFGTHDPTTPDRQGADHGTQYRSIVLYHDEVQRATAERVKTDLDASGTYAAPIVTEIVPLDRFYPAEEYHQGYFRRHAGQAYCRLVIRPKLEEARRRFADPLGGGSGAR